MKKRNLIVYEKVVYYNRITDLKILKKVIKSNPGESLKSFLKYLKREDYCNSYKEAYEKRIYYIKQRIKNAEKSINLNVKNIIAIRKSINKYTKQLQKYD